MSGELDALVRKLLMMQSDTPDTSAPLKQMKSVREEKANPLHTSARITDPEALRRLWLEDRCYSDNGTLSSMGFDGLMRQEHVCTGDCIQMISSEERERWNEVNKEVVRQGMHFGKSDSNER